MVFFANSGAGSFSEPDSELAASAALEAASEAWLVLSRIEKQTGKWTQKTHDLARSSAEKFDTSARIYEDISRTISTHATFDLSALMETARVSIDINQFGGISPVLPARALYSVFIKRIRKLAKALKQLDARKDRYALRGEIFEIMKDWEFISSSARIIAAGNSGEGSITPRPYAE